MLSCADSGCGKSSRSRSIYRGTSSSCDCSDCCAGSFDVMSGFLAVYRVQAQTVVPHCHGRCSRSVLPVAALRVEFRTRSFVTVDVAGVDLLLPRAVVMR